MRMQGKLHVVLGLLFVLALLFDLYLWGGLSKTPTMGPIVTDATTRELSLAMAYAPTGAALLDLAGLGRGAAEFAQAQFAPIEARVVANPAAAMETLVRDMPWLASLAYYGAPILLVAFLLAYWRRPRVLRSMQRRS